jgi:protein CMS1
MKYIQRIVIDASHIDQKRRGIIEMKDTHGSLVKLLNHPTLKNEDERLKEIELVFY